MMGMGFAAAILIYVWIASPFTMWTTHLAMIIFLSCCIYYILSIISNFRSINYDKPLDKPECYIDYLKKYKHERYIFNTRKYTIYSIFFTAGFILYTLIGVLFTFLWIGLCYFVLMRIYIKREEGKLEEMIQNLERLHKQFEDINQNS
jgi:hypothetical protein